jgi:ribonuclease HII
VDCQTEDTYRKQYPVICGVDEVGTGTLAGPIVAAAVILDLPAACKIEILTKKGNRYPIGDSKKIPPTVRKALYKLILENAFAVGLGATSVEELNEISRQGKPPLSLGGNRARVRAVLNLCKKIGTKFPHQKMYVPHFYQQYAREKWQVIPSLALVDYFRLRFRSDMVQLPSIGITHGDSQVISIAAASIVAKIVRDEYMTDLGHQIPQYDWRNNMGYGVPNHIKALHEFGPTTHHRTFALKKVLEGVL